MDKFEYHFSDLASRIAKLTGQSMESSEEFLKALIESIIFALETDGKAEIANLGSFQLAEKESKIDFTPSTKVEEIVNNSFSDFEPVVLVPGFPLPMNEKATETEIQSHVVQESNIDNTTPEPIEDNVVENETSFIPPPISEIAQDDTVTENTEYVENYYNEEIENEELDMNERKKVNSWLFWTGLVIGLLIGFIVGLILRPVVFPEKQACPVSHTDDNKNKDAVVIENIDDSTTSDGSVINQESKTDSDAVTKEEVKSENKGKIVYDTIKEGRYLAKISREHFGGVPEFWIYIYVENKDKIKDPGSVPIGTIITIPDPKKYDIDPNSAESIAKAKRRVLQFYNTGQ